MNESELAKLIRDTNAGEQNRNGDIEYKLPAGKRASNLEAIARALERINSKSRALNGLPSLIYWALCDEISVVNACIHVFVPLAEHPVVAEGFLRGLTSNLTLDFRQRYISSILDRLVILRKLNPAQSNSTFGSPWARLVLEAITSWSTDEQNAPRTQELVERLGILVRSPG